MWICVAPKLIEKKVVNILCKLYGKAVPKKIITPINGKFKFENQKKAHAAKKKQKQTQVKEIKFRPNTEEADYQVKLKSLIKFLSGGDKAKITMRFRGREIAHQVIGREFLDRVQKDLDDYGVVEQIPSFEGRQMVMVIAPKK